MGRFADVAIIEANDAKTFGRQTATQIFRPQSQLRRKACNEQNRRIAVAPEAFIFDVDMIGPYARHEASFRCAEAG
jgi:hypothetical protein